jgi:hypothetical protein
LRSRLDGAPAASYSIDLIVFNLKVIENVTLRSTFSFPWQVSMHWLLLLLQFLFPRMRRPGVPTVGIALRVDGRVMHFKHSRKSPKTIWQWLNACIQSGWEWLSGSPPTEKRPRDFFHNSGKSRQGPVDNPLDIDL